MGRGQGINGIDYGKIKVFSSDASLDDIYKKFEQIMDKYNYPESADEVAAGNARIENLQGENGSDAEEASGLTEEDMGELDELDEEEEEESAELSPWDVARRKMEKGEDDGGEK